MIVAVVGCRCSLFHGIRLATVCPGFPGVFAAVFFFVKLGFPGSPKTIKRIGVH